MNIVKAKNDRNKLDVIDDRVFMVHVDFLEGEGFTANFVEIESGMISAVEYKNRQEFNDEWKICSNVKRKEMIRQIIENYQE